jgi:hypothetical protein
MNLSLEKELLKLQIDTIDDLDLLEVLKKMIFLVKHEKYNTPMSMEEYNNKLKEAEQSYKQGKIISHNDMKTESEKWKKSKKQ